MSANPSKHLGRVRGVDPRHQPPARVNTDRAYAAASCVLPTPRIPETARTTVTPGPLSAKLGQQLCPGLERRCPLRHLPDQRQPRALRRRWQAHCECTNRPQVDGGIRDATLEASGQYDHETTER